MLEEEMKKLRGMLDDDKLEVSLNKTLVELVDAWDLSHVSVSQEIKGHSVTTTVYKGEVQ